MLSQAIAWLCPAAGIHTWLAASPDKTAQQWCGAGVCAEGSSDELLCLEKIRFLQPLWPNSISRLPEVFPTGLYVQSQIFLCPGMLGYQSKGRDCSLPDAKA